MQRCLIAICLAAVLLQPATAAKYPQAEWMARFDYRPFPAYPAQYRRVRMTGSGLYRLHVNERGRVTAVTVLKSAGHKELDILARNALLLWRGKAGPKWELDIPITFTMDKSKFSRNPATSKTYTGW
jgi:TonB family protein